MRLDFALDHPAVLFHVGSQPSRRGHFRSFARDSLFGLVDHRLHLSAAGFPLVEH